jgi:hypothetical protein
MSTFLNSNLRRTANKQRRFFEKIPRPNGLGLSICREDIAKACRSNSQTSDALGKGSPYQVMDYHGLRFRWFESSGWGFTGPVYGLILKSTCSRKDVGVWLDGLYAAEGSSRGLQRGPRLVHELGVEQNAEERVVCSLCATVVIWRNLDGRLYPVRLAEATAGTAEAIVLSKLIMYWTVTAVSATASPRYRHAPLH